MLRAYLVALCSGSSLDVNVKNFSLFNLIENVAVPPDALGQTLPFELHFYCRLEPAARNADFEMRVVRVDERGGTDVGDPLPFRTGVGGHFRLRVTAFRLPRAYGSYTLRIEWRRKGEERWNVDPLEWPVAIHPAQPARASGGGAAN